jgi:hypothetical protein
MYPPVKPVLINDAFTSLFTER